MRASIPLVLAGHAALSAAMPSDKAVLKARAGASSTSSSYDGSTKLQANAAPVQGAGDANGESPWSLSIDDTSSGYKQKVTGFGAAVTDSTVTTFNTLSSDTLSQLLNDLMTPSGANFAFMRHTIGASDLSGNPVYTYDDNGGNADPNLSGFGLGDRGTAMAALLAQMKKVQSDLTIFGSPWSAPGWMKLNNEIEGSTTNNNLNDGYLNGNMGADASAFAQYFVKYIQAYNAAGANIDGITIQNEPLNSNGGYPTMYMFAEEQAELIQSYVGPALSSAGLNTKIWAYDHNTDQPSFPQTVVSNAGQYVDTVAWHCYANPLDWTVLTDFKNNNSDVTQYMTECYTPQGGDGSWPAGFTMGPMQNWASGVAAWNLGADGSDGPNNGGGCTNCEGVVTVENGSYTLNVAYYMLAQFSKFIPVGATIVNGGGSYTYSDGTGIEAVGSVNPDGSRTVVIQNNFGNAVYITLNTTSGQWSGSVPAEGLTTWVLPN